MALRTCDNCDHVIGKLESVHDYQGNVVCAECFARLTGAATASDDPLAALAQASKSPSSRAVASRRGTKVQVIEQTSKKWKGLGCVGGLLCIPGIALIMVGVWMSDGGTQPVPPAIFLTGAALLLVGFAVAFVARLGAWWYHG